LLSDQASVKEKGKSLMASNKQEFKTAIFEDGTCAVLRADPTKPHLLEVIATFHDAARARDYVRFENNPSGEHQQKQLIVRQASAAKPIQALAAKPGQASEAKTETAAVSERQKAVLKALRSMMDKKHLVEATKAELAKAASIPSGSLRSVLASLEKKGMIRTERQGTSKFRAIYQVVETSRKSTPSLNSVVRGKEAHVKTMAH
jgi:DNA-binding transcriptional ArsR family regulator